MGFGRSFRRLLKRNRTAARRQRKVYFEALEPRLLLNSDPSLATPGVAAALSSGMDEFGKTIDEFIKNETLLDTQLPLIVRSGGDNLLNDYRIAPTIDELLRVDADINSDGNIAGADETGLYDAAMDSNGDNALDFSELFLGKFISDIKGYLNNEDLDQSGTPDIDEMSFDNFLDLQARDLTATYTSSDYPDRSYSLQVLDPVDDISSANQVSFELDFVLTFTNELGLDLGFTAEDQGIVPSAGLMVDASVFFTLEFGVITSGEDAENLDFFIEADDVTVSVEAYRELDDVSEMRIGFLGVEVQPGGYASLTANVIGAFSDPSDAGKMGFLPSQYANPSTETITAGSPLENSDFGGLTSLLLRIGGVASDSGSNTIEVRFDTSSFNTANLADIENQVQNELNDEGFSGLIEAETDTGSLALHLTANPSKLDITPLGFSGNEVFSESGTGALIASAALNNAQVASLSGTVKFLLSENRSLPKLVSVNVGAANTVDDLVQQIKTGLSNAGLVNVTAEKTDPGAAIVIKSKLATPASLEVTKTLTLDSKISYSDLTAFADTEIIPMDTRSSSGLFEVDLPIEVQPGLGGFQPSATIEFTYPTDDLGNPIDDPFTLETATDSNGDPILQEKDGDTRFNFDVQLADISGGYAEQDIFNFTKIDGSSMIGLFREFGRYLDGLSDSEDFTAYDIPFAAADLGDVLDFADMWSDTLLVDDKDTPDESDDDYKLINQNNNPVFATAQGLAEELGEILYPDIEPADRLAAIGAAYDTDSADLTYNIDLENAFPTLEVPVDFNLPIEPLDNVSSNSTVWLGGTGSLEMVLGINLGEIPGEYLTETTTLAELGVEIKTEQAVTGENEARTIYGRLTEDATFDITIGDDTYQVTVYAADAASLGFDNGQSANGTLTAAREVSDFSPGFDINFELTVGTDAPYVINLPTTGVNGTDDNANIDDLVADLNAALASATGEDGATLDITSEVQAGKDAQDRLTLTGGVTTSLTIASLGATSDNSSTNEAAGLQDLVDDINLALTHARLKGESDADPRPREDLSGVISVAPDGSRIKLSSDTDFTVTVADGDPAMNKLGLKAEGVAELEGDGVTFSLTTTKNVPRLVGQFTTDGRFSIEIDGITYNVTVEAGEAEANKTIIDLVNKVNRALKLPSLLSDAVSGVVLTDAATFSVAIDEEPPVEVVIQPDATNGDIDDLVEDINRAISGTPLDGLIEAESTIWGSESHIRINAADDSVVQFELTTDSGNPAQTILGLPQSHLSRNLEDQIQADSQGNRLVLTAVGPDIISFTVAAASGGELGFSSSQDSDGDDLVIYLSDGSDPYRVELDGAVDIRDVIDRIHEQTGGTFNSATGRWDPGDVTVQINDPQQGTGLKLTDGTWSNTNPRIFFVEPINNSNASLQLGIVRADVTRDANQDGVIDNRDADGVIDGAPIKGPQLAERFFLENATIEADFHLTTPPTPLTSIEIRGDDASKIMSPDLLAAHVGHYIDINDSEGFNPGRYQILSVDPDDSDPALLVATISDNVGETGAIDGSAELKTVQASGNFGFVGVDLVGEGELSGEVATRLVQDERGIDSIRNTQPAVTPTAGNDSFGQLILDLVVTPSLAEMVSGAEDPTDARLAFTVNSLGDPFLEESFAEPVLKAADHIEVSGNQTDWFTRGSTISIEVESDSALAAEVRASSYDAGSDTTTVALRNEALRSYIGHISGDATFSLSLDGGDPVPVEIYKDDTGDNDSIFDLAADINGALEAKGLESQIEAGVQDNRMILKAVDPGVSDFTLTTAALDPAVTELGFDPSQSSVSDGSTLFIEAAREWGLVLSNVTAPTPPDIQVTTPGVDNLEALNDLLLFDEIDFDDVIVGLNELTTFLEEFEVFGELSEPLLLVDRSVSDLMGFAGRFATGVEAAEDNPAETLQQLEGKLSEAFGFSATESIELSLDKSGPTPLLRFGLVLVTDLSEPLDVSLLDINLTELVDGIDLAQLGRQGEVTLTQADDGLQVSSQTTFTLTGDQTAWLTAGEKAIFGPEGAEIETNIAGVVYDAESGITTVTVLDEVLAEDLTSLVVSDEFVDLKASGVLEAEGKMVLDLDFGIDLGDPDVDDEAGQAYLYGTTEMVYDSEMNFLEGSGEDLKFRAGLGPFSLEISGGSASLKVFFGAALDFPGRKLIAEVDLSEGSPDIASQLDDTIHASFPTTFNGFDIGTFELSSNPGLLLPTGFRSDHVADYIGDDANLFDNILLAVDGVDLFLGGIQDLLDGEVFGFRLPLIGDQLADGARFIEDLRKDFVDPFRTAVETVDDAAENFTDADKNIISNYLFDLLGPDGVDLLLSDVDDPSDVSDYISLETNLGGPISETYIQWNITLGSTLLNPTPDIGLDLGIPGLNLKTEGNIELKIDWELSFGFGLSFAEGFYLDISDPSELELNVEVKLPEAAITGTLGFLSLRAEDKDVDGDGDSTGLSASFGINIITRNDFELLGHTDELPEGAEINDFLDERMTLTDLFGNLALDVVLGARAGAELGMSLEVSDDLIGDTAAGFPRVIADFIFDWEVEDLSLTEFISKKKRGETELTDVIKEGLNLVAFQDVTLDLGSYISDVLGPVLGKIQDVTEPIQPVIEILTEPIPVISDLGPDLTLLDIAAMAGRVDPRLLHAIADVITLINSIPDPASAESLMLNFGDYTIYDNTSGLITADLWSDDYDISKDTEALLNNPKALLQEFDDFDKALNDLGGGKNSKSVLKKMKDAGDFAFPIFDDPSQVFGLLTGKPAVLVTYDMDPLTFEFEWGQFFSVFGPLGVSINMEFSANIDFAFGYDTLGIQEYVEDGFTNPLLLLDGFYVSDTDLATGDYGTDVPELAFSGGLWAAAELNLLIARAGVAGGIYAEIEFDLYDPDRDGRVRIKELIGNVVNEWDYGIKPLAPLAIFDVHGKMWAKLFAFLEIDLFVFSYSYDFDITPPATLLEFDIPFTRPPNLATETGGNLQINAGDYAEQRLNANTTDGSEQFTIWGAANSLGVNVNAYGFTQSYDLGGSTIYLSGGEGVDTFNLWGIKNPAVTLVIDGGAGNDMIYLTNPGNPNDFFPGTAIIRGDEGDDLIYGGGGADEIYGGLGSDEIHAGGGNDLVFGDEGFKGGESVRAIAGPSDGDDIVFGGSGHDILIGGGGIDSIRGEGGDDIVIGDGGLVVFDVDGAFADEEVPNRDNVAEVRDTVRDFFFAGDLLRGDGDADEIYGGKGDDLIEGGSGTDFIFGEAGFDSIWGGNDGDTVFGDGWRMTDVRVAGRIDTPDHLQPTSGGEADEIHGGDGGDTIYGGGGPDLVHGDKHDDAIFGGSGADELYGDDGNDSIDGQGDPDLIFGGIGGDTIDGGAGLDVIYGDNGAEDYSETAITAVAVADHTITVATEEIENFGRLLHRMVKITAPAADPQTARIIAVEQSGDNTVLELDTSDLTEAMVFALLLDSETPEQGLMGNDRITAGIESDIIDGQWGSDSYTLNLRGADKESLVEVFDTGISNFDTDRMTVNGTDLDDEFLLRASADPDGLAFVALIKTVNNDEEQKFVERINFEGLERLTVNGLYGDDFFAVDDTHTETTLNGGLGEDFFQVGQLYRTRRGGTAGAEAGIAPEDYFATIETTRGWLSNGISKAMTIRAGGGDDEVVIFHNLATLTVFGDAGDDRFLVKAFALEGSTDAERGRVDLTGGAGADNIQYAVNAPVNIDGGDGLDTIVIIGTEFSDDFMITKDGVYGAGLNVNFKNVEFLTVDGAEGDDRFFVRSTDAHFITEIAGGLGSDTFFISGDTPPVVSNDLLGHSGIITHSVESIDTDYDALTVAGISANVADNDEPAIVVTQSDGSTIVSESGISDAYTVVLTRQPTADVHVKALAPSRTPEEEAAGAYYFRVYSDEVGAVNEADGTAVTLHFTRDSWSTPQTVVVDVPDNPAYDPDDPASLPDYEDEAIEGQRTGVINHMVSSRPTTYGGKPTSVSGTTFRDVSTEFLGPNETDANTPTTFPGDGSLIGGVIEIISGPGAGQSRYIVDVDSGSGTLTVHQEWAADDVPTEESEYIIRRYDNLQLVSIDVQLEDNDAAGVTVYALSGGDPPKVVAAEPTVIEAGLGDSFQVALNRAPTAPVTVVVTPTASLGLVGVGVSSTSPGAEVIDTVLQLTFTDADWDIARTVDVQAVDDDIREGFHYGAVTLSVVSADVDTYDTVTDETLDIPEDDKATSVILAHSPLTEQPDLSGPPFQPVTVRIDGLLRDPERYGLEASTIVFFDEDGIPEEIDGVVTVSYSYRVPGYDDLFVPHVNVLIGDNDTPGVLITQSDGSTDVIEGDVVVSGISEDTYTVVLTSAPDQDVTVDVTAIGTKTSRGPIVPVAYPFAAQVDGFPGTLVFTADQLDPEGHFIPGNWNVPQTVQLTAVDDDWVDGGDTKVFAPLPHTVSDIQGPLCVSGFGGVGSLVVSDPLMLPGETNVKPATGEVVDITADTLTVNKEDVLAVEGIDTLDDLVSGPDESVVRTVEITEGPNVGEFRRIDGYEEHTEAGTVVLTLNKGWDVLESDLGLIKKYAITDESRNFFVDETEQADSMFVFNEDSLADSVGILTERRLIGLGMGIDVTIGDQTFGGGITYTGLEALEINLGRGNDTFDVQSITAREDFRSVTVLNTGDNTAGGNDVVTVSLDREVDAIFALNTQGGDDVVEASGSTQPLVIFGGDGNDIIVGGRGEDIIFADRGRVDYRNSSDTIVTRLGEEPGNFIGTVASVDGLTVDLDIEVESSASAEFPLEHGGLDGLGLWVSATLDNGKVVSQTRTIVGNTESRVTVNEPFTIDVNEDSRFRITGIPEDQTDGGFWDPSHLLTWDSDAHGDDVVIGMMSDDIIFGGEGDDILITQAVEQVAGLVGEVVDVTQVARAVDSLITLLGGVDNALIVHAIEALTDFQNGAEDVTDFVDGLLALIDNPDGVLADDDTVGDVILGDQGRMILGHEDAFDPGEDVSILSFNFNAEASNGSVTGTAGAPGAEADHWNNLTGGGLTTFGEERDELITFDDGLIATGVTVTWGRNLDSNNGGSAFRDTHDQIDPGGDQNLRLFEGYLLTSILGTPGVDIGGLASHFRSYDVYVYLDADDWNSGGETSVRSISDGTTTYTLNDADGNTFTGTYVQATSTDPHTPESGNYVVFTGLTADVVSIRVDDDRTIVTRLLNNPAISAVQVVGQHHLIDRVETRDPEQGGNDIISSGGGPDLVFGGSGHDSIGTFGEAANGRYDSDFVVGDNGRVTVMLDELREIRTSDPEFGGDDTILTGEGEDLVFGGSGHDSIGTFGEAVRGRFDSDLVMGDNGRASFMLDELREIRTSDPEFGGDDIILTGNGEDLVFGGSGHDSIDTGAQGPLNHGDVRIISFNFNSGVSRGAVTGTAGAVAAANWNNLTGGDHTVFGEETGEAVLFDNGNSADGVTIEWGRNLDCANPRAVSLDSHDQILNPGTQNEKLFEGYLYTSARQSPILDFLTPIFSELSEVDLCPSSNWNLGVDVSGLAEHFQSYDVYVYLDADDENSGPESSVRSISDGTTTYFLDDAEGHTFQGEFVEASSTSAENAETGNYVVFRGMQGDVASIRVDTPKEIDQDTSNRLAITAVQIVGGPDKDVVAIGGDYEADTVIGDNGVGRTFGDGVSELETTEPEHGGDDRITTGEGPDLVLGGSGADEINGEAGHDLLLGDNGRLVLVDGMVVGPDRTNHPTVEGVQLLNEDIGGDDTLTGGTGDDLMYGQFGNDAFVFSGGGLGHDRVVEAGDSDAPPNDLHDHLDFGEFPGSVRLDLDTTRTQVVNGEVHQGEINSMLTLSSKTGFEDVTGSDFEDTIRGNSRDNTLYGGVSDDVIEGRGGDDSLLGGGGNDVIEGGPGDDRIDGGVGDDDIKGDRGDDLILGGEGDDLIIGWSGDDSLLGGEGNDVIRGGFGDDLIDAGAGDDRIWDFSGDDVHLGGEGDDLIIDLFGDDLNDAEAGEDRIIDIFGRDIHLGGEGDDWVRDGFGGDLIDGGAGDDDIRDFFGHDMLLGGDGDDTILGGTGDDTIEGGDGEDHLEGGSGQNQIEQDTGKGLLGLQGFFERFASVFNRDDFYTVNPNDGDPDPSDDRPPRLWLQDYLDHVREESAGQLLVNLSGWGSDDADGSMVPVNDPKQSPWLSSFLLNGGEDNDASDPNVDIQVVIPGGGG